jgi:hypothetical protein
MPQSPPLATLSRRTLRPIRRIIGRRFTVEKLLLGASTAAPARFESGELEGRSVPEDVGRACRPGCGRPSWELETGEACEVRWRTGVTGISYLIRLAGSQTNRVGSRTSRRVAYAENSARDHWDSAQDGRSRPGVTMIANQGSTPKRSQRNAQPSRSACSAESRPDASDSHRRSQVDHRNCAAPSSSIRRSTAA